MADAASVVAARKKANIPFIGGLVQAKGWAYVISWGHRLSGLVLIGYALFHVYTLTALTTPQDYDAKMKLLSSPFFVFLEWALAVPVILHAANGVRLILFELFGQRNDKAMISWALTFAAVYSAFMAALMCMGNQSVSPVFFWMMAAILGALFTAAVWAKVWSVRHAWGWKFQRISGAFLAVMIPAHFIMSHVNLASSHTAQVVITRMQSGFIKFIDGLILIVLSYHAAYALISLSRDYIGSKGLRSAAITVIILGLAAAAYAGLRLTLAI